MATFKFKNYDIYYEISGEGKPIIFLNGIMMSCASWNTFEKTMSKDNKFIRIDFLDQGKSARMDKTYTQDDQVEVLKGLFDHLKLDKAVVMGISYGGEVLLKFAIKYPNLVERIILSNTAAWTSPWLRDIGHSWNKVGATLDGEAYYDLAIPVIYSPTFYHKHNAWMENRRKILVPLFSQKEFQDRMKRLVDSAESHDCRSEVNKISCETLIISSQYDFLTPLVEQEFLLNNIENSHHVVIPDCGHASMYEKPLLFMSLVLGFANALDDKYVI